MIDINFRLAWEPKTWNLKMCKEYFHKSWPLTKNKTFEIQATNFANGTIIEFSFSWTRNRSHAGVALELGMFSRSILFELEDNRHWDNQQGRWQTKEETDKEMMGYS